MTISKREYEAYLRTDFTAFVEMALDELEGPGTYQPADYVEVIAHVLERVRNGDLRRSIINLPPRCLKSMIVSVIYVAWVLGQDPARQVMCISYSDDLAKDLSNKCRRLMESPAYKRLFPNTRISRRKNTETGFQTTRGGGRTALSMAGGITGLGGDLIILDDPMNAGDIHSEPSRRRAIRQFREVIFTRLNDRRTGAFIVVMQRLHVEDLVSHLMDTGNWEALVLPAIARSEEQFPMLGGGTFTRQPGDLLHPGRLTNEHLDEIQAEMDPVSFRAQFQQDPIPVEGNMLKREWFKFEEQMPDRERLQLVVQSWDTALSTSRNADYSVCTTWGIIDDRFYLLDVLRERLSPCDLEQTVIEWQRRWQAEPVLIERAPNSEHLIEELDRRQSFIIRAIRPEGSKLGRLAAQSSACATGHVVLPKSAPWLDDFLNELLAFPGGRDDQVDSVSQFLHWARGHNGRWWLEFRRFGPRGPERLRRPIIARSERLRTNGDLLRAAGLTRSIF